MLKIIDDFKDFALKGNMIDIAIGVIIGSAFNKVVDVLVKEIFLPPLTMLTGGLEWSEKQLVLKEATLENSVVVDPQVAIGYGKLFEASLDFLIISFSVFAVVRVFNKLRDKAEDPKDTEVRTPKNLELLDRIADSLERQEKMLKGINKEK